MIFEKEDKFACSLMYGDVKMKIPARKPYLVVYRKLDSIDPVNGQDYTIQEVVWALSETGARSAVMQKADGAIVEFESVKRFNV
jgi:hypothetical protein